MDRDMDLAARILDRLRQSPFSVEELAFDRKPSVSRILLANSKSSNFNGFQSGYPGGTTK
jgi:hypothetical protein